MLLRAFLCKFARVMSQSMSQKRAELIFYVSLLLKGSCQLRSAFPALTCGFTALPEGASLATPKGSLRLPIWRNRSHFRRCHYMMPGGKSFPLTGGE
jgi:hypothetical protein